MKSGSGEKSSGRGNGDTCGKRGEFEEIFVDISVRLPYTLTMNFIHERTDVERAVLVLIMKYIELDKKTRNYGTDVSIYHAEMHMVSAIAERPGIHIGGLAELFGITKGSVSEIVKKIERKSLVRKTVDKANLSKLSLYVTKKGETAHRYHMKYHEQITGIIEQHLDGATEDEVRFLTKFLNGLGKSVDKIEV